MEENILKILLSHIEAVPEKNSPFVPTAISGIPRSAKEIASHFREFIEWCIDEVYIDNREETTSIYLINGEGLTSIGFDTLYELYSYWLKEVKK